MTGIDIAASSHKPWSRRLLRWAVWFALAIVLIVAGVLSLVYGGFSYTKDTTAVKIGPIELSVKEKETVNIPMWAGIGAIVIGGLLLVLGNKKG